VLEKERAQGYLVEGMSRGLAAAFHYGNVGKADAFYLACCPWAAWIKMEMNDGE
jgi:hypothetical protein